MTSPRSGPKGVDQDLEVGPGFFSQELEDFLAENPDVRADHIELARQSAQKRALRSTAHRPVVLPRPPARL